MKYILFFVPAFLLLACHNDRPNGGPCTYDTDTVPGTIIRMDSSNTPYPDIWVTAEDQSGTVDTMRYSEQTHDSPTWEQCAERGLTIGTKLKCERQTIVKGDCDPVVFQVTKVKY